MPFPEFVRRPGHQNEGSKAASKRIGPPFAASRKSIRPPLIGKFALNVDLSTEER